MSTLHTIDASKTVERIIGVFPLAINRPSALVSRKRFRFIVSQRLLPKKDGKGRVAAVEILKSTMRTRDYIERGEPKASGCSMPCAMATPKACSTLTAKIESWRDELVEFESRALLLHQRRKPALGVGPSLPRKIPGATARKKQETEIEIER